MLTAILFILFLYVMIRLFILAVKAAWSIFKVLFFIIFCPLILFFLIVAGVTAVALPVLLISGIALTCVKG